MTQILGYLTPAEDSKFRGYAAALRLDATALANLLIIRELRNPRLPALRKRFDLEVGVERAKVVAHQRDSDTKAVFRAHAKVAGLKMTRAAAILFRAELHERWLERSMAGCQVDST